MRQAKYQIALAVDGRHTVSIESDAPAAVNEGLIWAQDTFKKLARMGPVSGGAQGAKAEPAEAPLLHRVDAETGAPICGVHDISMVWVDRNGGFWSCHQKDN